MSSPNPKYWPSARHFSEAMQCPAVCFSNPLLRETLAAVDRLGMPLVTSGQFAYVYKLKPGNGSPSFAVRCFRGFLGDREPRYRAIHAHLQRHRVPALASFIYEPEGIFVEGRRFPILFMEWIEGPTLDVYLDEVVTKREVVLHLAGEWLRLMKSLREASIAHGDLQHGNIIVERGSLRLVDLDGMFVPEMAGWLSSEVGHQHFQHPARDAQLFDQDLDNFSALVIYLSLISLADKPSLWAEHHDENLLFTRADFQSPDSSVLFGKIREIGPEHSRLADALATAAKGDPGAVPCLLDLVTVQSKLPSWMAAPLDLEVVGKTREVPRVEAPPQPVPVRQRGRATPAQRPRQVPSTPGSASVQSLFSAPLSGQASTATAPVVQRDPTQVGRNTFVHAGALLGRTFLWWYWGLYLVLKTLGLDVFYCVLVTIVTLATVCLSYGLSRALKEARAAAPGGPTAPALSTSPPAPAYLPSWYNKTGSPPLPPASFPPGPFASSPPTASVLDSIIGSRTLGIYHLPSCAWVPRISRSNQVGFTSTTEAVLAGYHPCRVCLP
jgi:Metal binding domain of Ada